MSTMYETIQGLPLFKGTTSEQISLFLEKTNVEFHNFAPSDIIITAGQQCSHIRFILSGIVKSCIKVAGGTATLCSLHGENTVFCPTCLFGLYTEYNRDVIALTEGSYMQIRKDQYFNLIQSDSIYLLNYINYISYRAQKSQLGLSCADKTNLEGWIKSITTGLLDRNALVATLLTTRQDLCNFLSLTAADLENELIKLKEKGILSFAGNLELSIK